MMSGCIYFNSACLSAASCTTPNVSTITAVGDKVATCLKFTTCTYVSGNNCTGTIPTNCSGYTD